MRHTRISVLAWLAFAAVGSFATPQGSDFKSIIEQAVQLQQAGDYSACGDCLPVRAQVATG